MGVVKLFRGVFNSIADSTKGLRTAQMTVRGERTMTDVPVMQQRGLVSMPKSGDVALVMQVDDLGVVIGSDSKDRPSASAGETILYADADTFVRLNPDKTVLIQSGPQSTGSKISISPDGSITIHGTKVTVKGDQVVNVLAPVVGLGEDAAIPNPLDGVVTRSCVCMFSGGPHPDSSTAVFAAKVGTP